jgi:phosphoribosyl-ATP pyrophosphohydrolase
MTEPESIVGRLATVIASRRQERPNGSYTVELLDAGHATIAAKIIEEAYELVSAVGDNDTPDRAAVAHEAADVVYHLLVFLAAHDCQWADVERELVQRFGISGLVEKANRAVSTPAASKQPGC